MKIDKDCTDEDREPNLTGLVPDYDLQLFREAQALASERIEDELKDLPVGKGIKCVRIYLISSLYFISFLADTSAWANTK